ncbi:hypothetical protein [Thalassobaculum litoreum]|nr:hypothetical protein [Thalassobaculum litoreum]
MTNTLPVPVHSSHWEQHNQYRDWTLTEKADRLFQWLIHRDKTAPLEAIRLEENSPEFLRACAVTDSMSLDELQLVALILAGRGHVEFIDPGGQGAPSRTDFSGRVRLTPDGWIASEQSPVGVQSDTAFVAMWFAAPMDEAKNAILDAIESAGYRPVIVSEEAFTGPIMDKILGEIRSARFLVADYTCGSVRGEDGTEHYQARGGVYLEAGFATGLGLEVISTVRSDLLDPARRAIHFDVQQYNHIGWDNPTILRDALKHRIGAIIGWGPHRATAQ